MISSVMMVERETIRSHARERLAAAGAEAAHARRVQLFRRFLKLETDRLRMRHRMGLGGREVAAMRSYQVDQAVIRACQVAVELAGPEAAPALGRVAIVALGGYGRAELAPYSDVDLLFLHDGRPGPEVRSFVEQVLLLLWDSGLSVGQSFRSSKECLAIAREDLHSRTALTEARLVTGSAEQWGELLTAREGLLVDRRAREAFEGAMRREYAERHAKQQGAVCVQEPNVKEGVGGLRDLHTVLWIAHASLGGGLAALESAGWIGARDHEAARRAYDFLLRVRNEAHFSTGRKSDLLTLDLQNELAQRLDVRPRHGLLGSEVLMREYYRRASEIAELARTVVTRDAPTSRSVLTLLRERRAGRRFHVRNGRLEARSGVTGGGGAIIEAFAAAQAEDVPLSAELRAEVRSRLSLIDADVRRDRSVARTFLDILRWRGRVGRALRAMHETGVLGRYLPEFGRVSFLVQHDFFHRYTVDEHTLRAIEALDEVALGVGGSERALGRVFDEVEDAAPLYLGLLLHDVGKGRGGAHVAHGARVAPRVCERLGMETERAADTVFLVSAHLEMSQLSQQRDLSEPGPIAAFAERVGRLERLDQLLLLTYADHRGVGPGIWNEWKSRLLWELYDRTRERLAGHPLAAAPGQAARARAAEKLLASFPAAEVGRHLASLPERYLRATNAEHVERHFRLASGRGDAALALDWRDLASGHGTELTVVADDRPGLFADIAGTLTANGVDILSVDLFSRADGVVIDTFRVAEQTDHQPIRPERRARVEAALPEAVRGSLDVAAAVERWRARTPVKVLRAWGRAARPPSVRFDNEGAAVATVIEVRAQDRPGLAWTIAATLAALGMDISFAKVATAKALALDVFYVTDGRGQKLESESLPRVEAALLAALAERSPAPTAKEAR
jgi:[protein-PII] uridylyltransferase